VPLFPKLSGCGDWITLPTQGTYSHSGDGIVALTLFIKKENASLVVECFSNVYKALGSTPSTDGSGEEQRKPVFGYVDRYSYGAFQPYYSFSSFSRLSSS
jgi:hypothetical protein